MYVTLDNLFLLATTLQDQLLLITLLSQLSVMPMIQTLLASTLVNLGIQYHTGPSLSQIMKIGVSTTRTGIPLLVLTVVILTTQTQLALKTDKLLNLSQYQLIQDVDLTTLVHAGTQLVTSILMLEVMKPILALNQLHLMHLPLILMVNSQVK